MIRAILVSMIVALIPVTANAIVNANACGARGKFLEYLSANFNEVPVAIGLTSDGKVLEVRASGSGTWTILVTMPAGATSSLMTGEAWFGAPPPDDKTPDSAS